MPPSMLKISLNLTTKPSKREMIKTNRNSLQRLLLPQSKKKRKEAPKKKLNKL